MFILNPASSVQSVVINLSGTIYNYVLNTDLTTNYGWNGKNPINVKLNIASSAIIGSISTSTYALTINSFPASSNISLNVMVGAYIVGAGGQGGGGGGGDGGGGSGGSGGPAISTLQKITITNLGTIQSGGGGGGGGGCEYTTYGWGGNGGGGAGAVPGWSPSNGYNGAGNSGTLSVGGGAQGGGTSGAGSSGAGGAPGAYGQNGSVGSYNGGGNGGPPGYAITGISNVTWIAKGTILGPTQ